MMVCKNFRFIKEKFCSFLMCFSLSSRSQNSTFSAHNFHSLSSSMGYLSCQMSVEHELSWMIHLSVLGANYWIFRSHSMRQLQRICKEKSSSISLNCWFSILSLFSHFPTFSSHHRERIFILYFHFCVWKNFHPSLSLLLASRQRRPYDDEQINFISLFGYRFSLP